MMNSHSRPVGDDECVSEAVLKAVAAASDQSLVALPPLQESVDMDFVDRLFVPSTTIRSIRFSYAGHEVVLERNQIRVH
jgi:hypothetical protein